MPRFALVAFLLCAAALARKPSLSPVDLPRVLLIGDSICLGYTPRVQELLADRAHVERIDDPAINNNAQHTGTGLARLDMWLGDEPWDVIHFNWGLWDLCYRAPTARSQMNRDKVRGTLTTTIEQYEQNLDAMVARLKTTGATLIWASTTPVPEGEIGRFVGDDLRYNEAALRVMRHHNIAVNDLHAAILPVVDGYASGPGDVHFKPAGSQFLATRVVEHIDSALARRASTTARPNVIVFLVDDMGWQDTSVPFYTELTPFNKRYRTPNMQRLAARGVKFTNAYASAPVCTPTRTSIMTGQSPGQTRITFWTLQEDRDTSGNHPTLAPPKWNLNGIQHDDVTLPRLLLSAGYRTIHAGKAHFGTHGTSGSAPENLGFSVNIAGHASGAPGSYYGMHHFANVKKDGGPSPGEENVWDVPGLEKYHGQDIYLTEALSIEACDAVNEAVDADVPFYLYFAPYAVHTPIMANSRYLDHYSDLHPIEAAYATMVESMDAALGDLLDVLDHRGIADDTIVIFSSDNGGLSAHARGGEPNTHNEPLASGKGSSREGGVRVPTIIAWPGVADAGSTSDTPIISHDFFPTVLAMAGVPIPEDHRPSVEGLDLTPLLHGDESAVDPNRALFWHQPHQWGARGPGIEPFTSVRRGDWKLIYNHAGPRFELFNLEADLSETTDLAQSRAEIVEELAAIMTDWITARGVQLSRDKATGEPIPLPAEVASALSDG